VHNNVIAIEIIKSYFQTKSELSIEEYANDFLKKHNTVLKVIDDFNAKLDEEFKSNSSKTFSEPVPSSADYGEKEVVY
jgi:hypothetical protein